MLQADPQAPVPDRDPRVRRIVAFEAPGSIGERLAAVRSLPARLPAADAEVLYARIIVPPVAPGMPAAEWAALYNDVLNVLGALDTPLPDYPARLQTLLAQEERDAVLRDYALQHLLAYVQFRLPPEQRSTRLAEAASVARAAAGTTLPGTYLLGIYQQAGKPGYPEKAEIARQAAALASDPEARTLNRISAIQICAQLDHTEALATAVELARDAQLPAGLRVAAIAAIGQLGSAEHRALLTQLKYQQAPDFRLQHAAERALQHLP